MSYPTNLTDSQWEVYELFTIKFLQIRESFPAAHIPLDGVSLRSTFDYLLLQSFSAQKQIDGGRFFEKGF